MIDVKAIRDRTLADYVPDITSDILDFKHLYASEDKQIDLLAQDAQDVAYSFFVSLCDNESIRLWERIFLVNNADLSLEQRKREVIKLLSGYQKMSTKSVERIVLNYTSYMAGCVFDKETSEIQVSFLEVGRPPGVEPLIRYLNSLAPAHLQLVLTELYRTHEALKDFSHEYLSQYTHAELYAKRII